MELLATRFDKVPHLNWTNGESQPEYTSHMVQASGHFPEFMFNLMLIAVASTEHIDTEYIATTEHMATEPMATKHIARKHIATECVS